MDNQTIFRQQLLNYLTGEHAHASLAAALKNFPVRLINAKPAGSPYTFWQLLEHIRISQADILEFITNPDYKDLDWPGDYWPKAGSKAGKAQWDKSIKNYQRDLAALVKIVKDPKTDLLTPLGHGDGQTIFREAMLVIDHAAYHTGQFILMRRQMDAWKQ